MFDFIAFIKTECRKQGINQKTLAQKSGNTEATVSRYFNQTRIPHVYNLERMLNVLGYELTIKEREDKNT